MNDTTGQNDAEGIGTVRRRAVRLLVSHVSTLMEVAEQCLGECNETPAEHCLIAADELLKVARRLY